MTKETLLYLRNYMSKDPSVLDFLRDKLLKGSSKNGNYHQGMLYMLQGIKKIKATKEFEKTLYGYAESEMLYHVAKNDGSFQQGMLYIFHCIIDIPEKVERLKS